MNDCPNCEYHRQRAARWRAEAYKLGGYDGIELPWKGLTDEERVALWGIRSDGPSNSEIRGFARAIEAKLKQKNFKE